MKLNAYVNFAGNCKEALQFYEKHLGAKIQGSMTYEEMPEPKMIPPGMEKNVLHAQIKFGDSILMVSDGPKVEPMRSAYLTLTVESSEEAERIYKALSKGGQIFLPIGVTFFALKFAQLRDKFGINWMIIHERPRP
jgi:PhnB protein